VETATPAHSDEEARLRLIWAPNPRVDPALLDDAKIEGLRHSAEWRALGAILVGLVLLGIALAIVRPFAEGTLQWLPGPLVRLMLQVFHPSGFAGAVLIVLVGTTLLDVGAQWLEVHDTLADAVEITPETLPQYYPVVAELRERFKLPKTRIFVSRTSPMVPFAAGLWGQTVVVFNMGVLLMFTLDEFKFLLGHELGHIKLGHTRIGALVGGSHMKLGGVAGPLRRVKRQLTARYQYAQELSCDRIGVLATHDVGPAVSTLIKWSGGVARGAKMDLTTLAGQAEELRRGPAATAALLTRLSQAQPRLIERLRALTEWAGLPKPKPPAAPDATTSTTQPPTTTPVTTQAPPRQAEAGA
jgi:Zn-dependent protease with chaperone function